MGYFYIFFLNLKNFVLLLIFYHNLEGYIFLIAMLGMENANVDVLRAEQEDFVIREFERYAAGGLEFLRTEFEQNPTQSPDLILEKMFRTPSSNTTPVAALPDL